MSLIFDQLEQDEKIALEVAIVYPHRTLSDILPEFYGRKVSKSTLYRYHRDGINRLISRGLVDIQGRPTAKAFDVIPERILREMIPKLCKELTHLSHEKSGLEIAKFSMESELKKMKEHQQKLESELTEVSHQLALISKNKVLNVMRRFDFLGIDENWVSVLVALNLVEMAMKVKIESLGTRPKGSFKELYDLLKREVSTKEKREISTSSEFIKPKHLYNFRSKMDHEGLKVKIKEKEADFIIEQAFKFIKELRIG